MPVSLFFDKGFQKTRLRLFVLSAIMPPCPGNIASNSAGRKGVAYGHKGTAAGGSPAVRAGLSARVQSFTKGGGRKGPLFALSLGGVRTGEGGGLS